MQKYYLGLANTYHDPALAVVNQQGEVLFAEAAERSLQSKRAYGLMADVRETVRRVINDFCDPGAEYVVAKAWSSRLERFLKGLALVGFTDHERIPRRPRTLTRYLVGKHRLFSECWLQYGAFVVSGGNIADILWSDFGNKKVSFVKFDHHLAHAANASFTSPFDEAACMVVDGQAERGSISYFHYENGRLRELARPRGRESLGMFYSVCTHFCGFSMEKGEEWKLMGLAPYGKLDPELLADFQALIRVDGLSLKYPPLPQIEAWFRKMQPRARASGASPLNVADLAYTTQFFYSEVMSELLTRFYALGISKNLVLGGGCALNSAYNGQIVGRTGFKRLHVPSAPADDGNAIGVALLAYYRDHPDRKRTPATQAPYLGSTISKATLANAVRFGGNSKTRHLPGTVHQEAARLLAQGKLLGWVQGRAEFGPRALGSRSILADPRPADMKERINARVKFREEFRPFGPSILDEFGPQYFEHYQPSPYMERTLRFKEAVRATVPAVVHVDGSGRLHSVRREWNERFYDLIYCFYKLTGVPLLLNTSFNVMGKPIIHSVEDALGLFYTTGLDALVIEDCLFEK